MDDADPYRIYGGLQDNGTWRWAGLPTWDKLFGGDGAWPLIAYVGPRSPILQGSLRRALTLGVSPRPDDDTIHAMAARFGLGALIERLGGLGGRVGESGRTLSDGSIRRIRDLLAVFLVKGVKLSKPDTVAILNKSPISERHLRRRLDACPIDPDEIQERIEAELARASQE